MSILRRLPAFLVALTVATPVHADVDIRVGLGAGCDTSSIQTAIGIANNANGISNIKIAANQAYTEQALTIDGKNVRLIGGYANCTDSVGGGITWINGAGGAARSTLDIKGVTSMVAVHNLRFLGGDELTDNSSYGGAVDITGGPHALVYFENNWFASGYAGWGGGVSIRNASASRPQDVLVRFGPNNVVTSNRAHWGGGGIFCRSATLDITGAGNGITSNYAGDEMGDGGGLYLDDCVVKLVGTTQTGVVAGNTASRNGGGLYVTGGDAVLDIYNLDPEQPTRIAGNLAQGYGGGIDIEHGPIVYFWDAIIENNVARLGGGGVAVYADAEALEGDHSTFLATRNVNEAWQTHPPPPFARNCAQAAICNAFTGNRAEAADGTPRDGAALRLSADRTAGLGLFGSSIATLRAARMDGNAGRTLVWAKSWEDDAFASFFARGSVFHGNEVSQYLIDVDGDEAEMDLVHNTITGNTIGVGVLRFEDDPAPGNQSEDNRVLSNIVWQPGTPFFVNTPLTVLARYNVANELGLVPASERPFNRDGNPLFVNASAGDYRVHPASPAVEYGPPLDVYTRDGLPRPVDLPTLPNAYGPADAGAYEVQLADRIFAHGFE